MAAAASAAKSLMRLVLALTARKDIQEIMTYYRAPSRMGDEFNALFAVAVEHLGRWPYTGHRRRDLTKADVCFWFEEPYLFAFQINGDQLSIAAILHSSQNVARILQQRFRSVKAK
jgi:plasmid stabilization system protein ParE